MSLRTFTRLKSLARSRHNLMRAQIGWKMASVMSTIRGMALTTILGREVSAADRNDADPHGLHPEGPFDFGDGD